MLESVGISLPNYRVRDITTELSEKEVRDVSKAEFARLCQELTRQDVSRTFKTSKQHDRDAVKIQGEMGATHLVLNEVQKIFLIQQLKNVLTWSVWTTGARKEKLTEIEIEQSLSILI